MHSRPECQDSHVCFGEPVYLPGPAKPQSLLSKWCGHCNIKTELAQGPIQWKGQKHRLKAVGLPKVFGLNLICGIFIPGISRNKKIKFCLSPKCCLQTGGQLCLSVSPVVPFCLFICIVSTCVLTQCHQRTFSKIRCDKMGLKNSSTMKFIYIGCNSLDAHRVKNWS